MSLYTVLQNKSKFFFIYLLLLGLVNSLWASVLLFLINSKIVDKQLPIFNQYDWVIYLSLIVISYFTALVFQKFMIQLTYSIGNELCLSIFEKLKDTSYEKFKLLGEERIRTAMADVNVIQSFPQYFISVFNNAILSIISVVYLISVNVISGLMVFFLLLILGIFFSLKINVIEKEFNNARSLDDIFQNNVNDFIKGFKELNINTIKRETIYQKFMTNNRRQANNIITKSWIKLLNYNLLGTYVWYFVIGFVLFLLPFVLPVSISERASFLVTILFIMGPASELISKLGDFIVTKVAYDRLSNFNKSLTLEFPVSHSKTTLDNSSFESLTFSAIEYKYPNSKALFQLGPIDLLIKKGETIFITGGNGSGKSTFMNLLIGLTNPTKGEIYLNEILINSDNINDYKDKFSVIFTDNHLFSENYDEFDLSNNNHQFGELIHLMKLEEKLDFENYTVKINKNLSQGQKKRLALIYSLLEKKQIIVLDEWAAEQDPEFRNMFYRIIIPKLKSQGKTIIAITHDDKYFGSADRLIKFDYGQVVVDTNNIELIQYENY